MQADPKSVPSSPIDPASLVDPAELPARASFSDWFAGSRGRATTSAAFSAVVHCALLLLLGFFTMVTAHGPQLGNSLLESSVTVADLPLESLDSGAKLDARPALTTLKSTSGPVVVQPMVTILASGPASYPPLTVGSDALIGRLTGFGSAGSVEDLGAKGMASFFGAVSVGKKFVYVLDNSNSMNSGKFERACAELIDSISKLSSKQSYYIIFFSDQAYPLYHPRESRVMLQAITLNTMQTARWIKQQELHRGTRARQAFEKAFALKPDAIYVLTDGRFTDNTEDYLLGLKDNKIPIHAIGFGRRRASGEDSLRKIVAMHQGTYTFVPVK
jgi:hypothetical protein